VIGITEPRRPDRVHEEEGEFAYQAWESATRCIGNEAAAIARHFSPAIDAAFKGVDLSNEAAFRKAALDAAERLDLEDTQEGRGDLFERRHR
jgi:hypothetical protein